jgi:DMSO reductase anchor subunit
MTSRSGLWGRGFHEAPLVLFTALAVAGAGIGASRIGLAVVGRGVWASSPGEAGVVAGLLALGLAASILHLGRPLRAGLALRGAGRSALTTEVLVLGAAAAAGALAALLPAGSALGGMAGALLPWLSILTLVTLGSVYRLPGQVGWGGAAVFRPLVLGLVFGMVAQGTAGSWSVEGPALVVLLFAWVADALLLSLHARQLERYRGRAEPSHPAAFGRRRSLLASRLALVDLAGPGAFLLGMPSAALVLLAVGLLLDRALFYALAARWTNEGEMGWVERLLAESGER